MDTIDTSKTHRFYLLLKERILSGVLSAGQRLPSEPALAESHGLSRVTVRRALDGLAREGLITRQAGAGTFVRSASSGPVVAGDLTNMLASLVAMGEATSVTVLDFTYVDPAPAIAAALGLAKGERCQRSVRVRSLKGTPFSHLTTHVPERIGKRFTRVELTSTPLLTLLEHAGAVAERAHQTISATLAGPDSASALGVEIGAPLISLTRIVYDEDGKGIEHLAALYRPDIHAFHMELTRSGDGAERHWRPARRTTADTDNANHNHVRRGP